MGRVLSTMKQETPDIFCEEISAAPKKTITRRISKRKMNAGTFNCEQCDRKFSTRWNLQQHVHKRHSKKKEQAVAQVTEPQEADIQLLFSAQAYKIGEFIVYVTKNA